MFRIIEKDLETRLDSLYSQNLYNLAINMVSSSAVNTFHSKNVDENPRIAVDNFSEINSQLIMEIHKRFADYLVCFFYFYLSVFQIRLCHVC